LSQSSDIAQERLLEDELPLLVLLRALVCFVVSPTDHLFALPASDIPDSVPASSHVAVAWLGCLDVHHAVEEEGFAMLATEVLPTNRLASTYIKCECDLHG
jgi:hypothetical protein